MIITTYQCGCPAVFRFGDADDPEEVDRLTRIAGAVECPVCGGPREHRYPHHGRRQIVVTHRCGHQAERYLPADATPEREAAERTRAGQYLCRKCAHVARQHAANRGARKAVRR